MKLTVLLLTAALMQVHASGLAQTVTFSGKDVPVKKLFEVIKKQTGYVVFYNQDMLTGVRPVTITANNMPLNELLAKILKNQPIDYIIREKTIVLTRKAGPLVTDTIPAAKKPGPAAEPTRIFLTGRLINDGQRPIPSATISVSGTNISSVSDASGYFNMAVPEQCTLVISSVGYKTTYTTIKGRPADALQLTMQTDIASLDQVQVVAYGTTTKRLSTGSVSTVNSSEIRQQPVSNPLQALSGRVPGIFITENSGVAGSASSVQIRGQNTILGQSVSPLYIIDGVPFNGSPIENTGSASAGNPVVATGFSPLDNIPTSDIESIDVLKDADATALYGSRAANGVIIITTKRGKPGKTKVDLNLYSGVGNVARTLPMLNLQQYLALRNQAFANDNLVPSANLAATTPQVYAPDLKVFDQNTSTNFQDMFVKNTSHFTDATASVSGGNQQTQYMVSANYRRQTPVFPGKFSDDKTTIRFNIQSRSDNNKFSINFSGAYTKNQNNLPPFTLSGVYNLPPNLPLYNPDGSLYWISSFTNPAATLRSRFDFNTENIIGNSTIKYNILPGLSFKTDLGFNRIGVTQLWATTKASKSPFSSSAGTGTLITSENYNEVYTVEPQLNYTKTLGRGRLEALVGGTWQDTKYVQPYFINGTFTSDLLYNSISSLTLVSPQASGFRETKYASLFGRLNYTWNSRYIINFSGRRDGSSRFGPGNRFGNFGSAGAAWIFSEERWIKNTLSLLSFGKLRASYGTVGNDQISDYGYLSTYAAGTANVYNGINPLNPQRLANDNYGWEVTKKLEVAMDLNFFDDRIAVSAAWYRNRSSSLLIAIPVASQTGFSSYNGNLPALVQNTGLEFTVQTRNISSRDFKWTTALNFSAPKNILLSYPGLANTGNANSYVVGQSLNLLSGYHLTGVVNGLAQVEDKDKNGTISTGLFANAKGDQIVAGNGDPKFYGGLNNSFSWKGLQLDVLFQFVKRKGYNIYRSSSTPGTAVNLASDIQKYNFTYSTLSASPAATAYNLFSQSDAAVGDASFIRLKTLSLSYNFDPSIIRQLKMQQLSIYMRAQNLLTVTKYVGFDPETQGISLPPLRLISFGFQTSF